MLHNGCRVGDSGSEFMTRIGSYRLAIALAAVAATPAIVFAGPIPPLPPLPGQTQPQPSPQPSPPPQQQSPAPGTQDNTYEDQGGQSQPAMPTGETQPYAYSGPIGRVRLGGVWGYKGDPGDKGLRAGWQKGNFVGHHMRVPYVANASPAT